jgi:ankyrin repeat protein
MVSPFARSLPQRVDLAQQKTQAKELLRAFAAGDENAVARVRDALPGKSRITLADTQFVLSREYGFRDWPTLKRHIEDRMAAARAPHEQMHDAMQRRDAPAARRLLTQYAEFRPLINAPLFPFNAPALVACANDAAMIEVLLEFGADPNKRSEWWAGAFHPLHIATGAAATRLLEAGAVPDACAAAHLDRPDLLAPMLAADRKRVNERGGDGQTPLHFARSRAVVDLLLSAGADIDARDLDHRATPAEWMLERSHGAGRYALAEYLVERGATTDIFLAAALGRTDRVMALLHDAPALLDEHTGRGRYADIPPSSSHIYQWSIGANRSPMDVAAQFGHEGTVAAMLPFSTPVQQLRLACRRVDDNAAHALLREHGNLLATLGPSDRRAITDAAWDGNARAVELMLSLGFDPATPGQDSGTALHCAAWQGSAATVAALLRYPNGRALIMAPEPHHGGTPLGWCCHGSIHGPRGGEFAAVAQLLLEAGAQPESREASDEVEDAISRWSTESEAPPL